MTNKEKENQINILIDALCVKDFINEYDDINDWIEQIEKVYSNNYRHSYSSISYKIQQIINDSNNSETLEILGENLNELENKFNQMITYEPKNIELQKANIGFKKLSDHIKLEIGRYNFYKKQFNNTNNTLINNSCDFKDISKIKNNISTIERDFEQIKLIANEAKKSSETISELENKVDVKLESNKISSITGSIPNFV